MSTEENKAVIRRFIEEVMHGVNLGILDEILAPDVFNYSAVPEHQRGIGGYEHVIRWARDIFPDGRYEIEDIIAEGDRVACRITFSGTHEAELWGVPPTGKRFSVGHVHWYRLAEGRVVEHWAVRDDLGAMKQLGVIS